MHSHVNITPFVPFPFTQLSTIQSEIEEALVRIKNLEGVEGYVVCNNEGMVLRHQADMDKKVAEELAKVCCGVSPR
jgi:predicted regulator of Ras-like GTPase activity (Roadblock/LC7/MglB family)